MQQPSIGRIVHYVFDDLEVPRRRVRPAIVVDVYPNGDVDLHVFFAPKDFDGCHVAGYRSEVAPSSDATSRGWAWPPKVGI